jgi:glutamate formiminotransferase / formiminotetrahydrofolate cyclodeaminase
VTPFECVPNFSEGRDDARVEAIVAPARATVGVTVLDVERNADHNRCVVTLYGEGEPLLEAVLGMMRVATRTVDLTSHRGEHPRMGATDVVPFVPLGTSSMAEAVTLAERLGERVARELEIPVYLYAKAARRPERVDLAKVRDGQFEGIRDSIASDPARSPDFGPARVHRTAGAVAIGARPVLIAYNVLLATPDVAVAKGIAKKVRARDGGLPEVKALGFEIAERHRAQVSMNLTDYRVTSVARAFDAVRLEAERLGVGVEESEVVGLVPEDALLDAAEVALRLKGFDRGLVLERKVRVAEAARPGGEPIASFAARLAARTPTPGGGSAAAVVASLASALGEMVLAYSYGAKNPDAELEGLHDRLGEARRRFLVLADDDSRSYEKVQQARRLRKAAADDPAAQQSVVAALRGAASVPLETARGCRELAAALAAVQGRTRPALASDLVTALALYRAGAEGALANVAINVEDLKGAGEATADLEAELGRLRGAA